MGVYRTQRYLLTELILCWNHNTTNHLVKLAKSRHLVKLTMNGENHGFRDCLLSLLINTRCWSLCTSDVLLLHLYCITIVFIQCIWFCSKLDCVQRPQTPPRLLHCLRDRGCIVGEKRSGALCRVKIHHIKPDLHYVNGSGQVIVVQYKAL